MVSLSMPTVAGIKKKLFSPGEKKSSDGRDQWGSRTSYVLASMGGAVGFGNLLRYPSQVFNNNGLQWFIPYLLAITLLAIPVLILEVSLGQAFRGGPVTAYNSTDRRLRGVGLGQIWVAMLIALYYVPMLAYVLRYFEASFKSPLPWEGDTENFYAKVTGEVPPVEGDNGYMVYPGISVIPELAGWTVFAWFCVWICLAKGIATTGKVVYFTMGFPLVMLIVLIGRGVSLPNARDGICLFWCEFNGGQLAQAQIWQDATAQVFYSTGVGFGYFMAYASYNSQQANAVADAIIICCSNAGFETMAAFAVFGVVGYLGMTPQNFGEVSSFSLGFLTFPAAIAQLPGAQVWGVLFFFTLFLLGLSSSFAMMDVSVTTICDTPWSKKYPRIFWSSLVCVVCFLISLIYTTEFGFYLLDGIDVGNNNILLPWVVWSECIAATVVYRHRDVIGQVGPPGFATHLAGYFGGKIVGLTVAHTVSPPAGAGVGFGIYFVLVIASLFIAKTPDSPAPSFWGRNTYLSKFWWMGAYSGNQIRRDLTVTVAPPGSSNWALPPYWPVVLRYFTAPVLVIVYSFHVTSFKSVQNDPLYIMGFTCAYMGVFCSIIGFFAPDALAFLIPPERREEGDRAYAPQVLCGLDDIRVSRGLEVGSDDRSSESDGLPRGEKLDSEKKQDGTEVGMH